MKPLSRKERTLAPALRSSVRASSTTQPRTRCSSASPPTSRTAPTPRSSCLEHPPTYTLGARGDAANILASEAPPAGARRGGRAHGPRRRRHVPRARPDRRLSDPRYPRARHGRRRTTLRASKPCSSTCWPRSASRRARPTQPGVWVGDAQDRRDRRARLARRHDARLRAERQHGSLVVRPHRPLRPARTPRDIDASGRWRARSTNAQCEDAIVEAFAAQFGLPIAAARTRGGRGDDRLVSDVRLPATSQARLAEGPLPRRRALPAAEALMREQGLHTVCEEARCPNIGECWNAGTATFMILGDMCTRSCGFCAVTTGRPGDHRPAGAASASRSAVAALGLDYVVITSVNRDDRRVRRRRDLRRVHPRDPARTIRRSASRC